MSKVSDQKSKALGAIAAVQTLLERYPVLVTVNNDGSDTSFGFMLNILKIIGVSEYQIIEWVANLLSGKVSDGILEGLEQTVKAILLANVKNLFTCSLNPFIPDRLMDKYISPSGTTIGGEGIELDLDSIDLYGVLGNCPVDRQGGNLFYFDASESDYNDESENLHYEPYTVNELWKSRDFNAYLWFVINKGQSTGTEKNKLYWDNRIKYYKTFKYNEDVKNKFFNTFSILGTDESKIPITNTVSKAQIIRCEYVERPTNRVKSNVLKIYINPARYYAKRKISYKSYNPETGAQTTDLFWVNKTIFEFNYDYIYSLKLFNSKTLVAAVVNALLGIIANISLNYSIKRDVVAAQIGEIVKNIIKVDDTEVDDCYFTFSNNEYDRMLAEAMRKHNGTYRYNDEDIEIDYSSIIDSINDISNAATLHEQTRAISKVFTDVSATLSKNGSVSEHDKFSFGLDIIFKLLQETITQIVMQVLSPKVAILFKVNSEIMGNLDPEEPNWGKFDSWEAFLKNFRNLVTQLIKEIKEMIIKQLYKWLMEQIQPLLELFVSKIMLETIRYYRELIAQLIGACGFAFGDGLGLGNGGNNEYAIDNVNYADIVPVQDNPNVKTNGC